MECTAEGDVEATRDPFDRRPVGIFAVPIPPPFSRHERSLSPRNTAIGHVIPSPTSHGLAHRPPWLPSPRETKSLDSREAAARCRLESTGSRRGTPPPML
jgi:hypothetical protein